MTALLSLLENIQQKSQQLIECLQQEKLALDNSQYEQLCEIAINKEALVETLQTLDKERSALCPEKNFNQYIADSENQPLIKLWQVTRQLIAECQQQNEINGRLLNRQNTINQETMSILSGRDQNSSQTYNAQGSQANNNSLLGGIKA